MTEEISRKLQQTRASIESRVELIDRCFTEGETVADQLERACDLLLDFAKQFAVNPGHSDEAIGLKSAVNDLRARERGNEVKADEFRTEAARIRRQALELKRAMRDVALAHLVVVEQAPPGARKGVETTSALIPPSPLRESLERYLQQDVAQGVVFRCTGVSKRYSFAGPLVLDEIALELKNGEITGLVGLNGSGKSTLLRIIAGSLEATRGTREYPELHCKPTDWVTIRRSIAFVAQRPEPWAGTVEDALALQAASFGDTGKKGHQLVEFYLARLGMTPYRYHTWGQLSGGYRTRFELARVMLSRPKMLVLDEPLAALDIPAQMRFLTDLKDFATTFAKPMPVLLSSQNLYETEAIADRMVVIRDGKPIYNGPTGELGAGRAVNGFELWCDLDLETMQQALAGVGLKSIQKLGPKQAFVTVEKRAGARDVLQALMAANATVEHFRDASRSTRMFFES